MKIRPKKEKKKRVKRLDLTAGYCEDEDEINETTIKTSPMCNISKYLKSLCQIVLMPGKSSKLVLSGAEDSLCFDDTIFFIKDRVLNEINCPICLGEPTIPVVTKCGHIFCYLCITQTIVYAPPSCSSTCPVCLQNLSHDGIRLVIWRSIEPFKCGASITMDLCTRNPRHSTVNTGDGSDIELPALSDRLVEKNDGNWYTINDSPTSSRDFTRILKFPKNGCSVISMLNSITVIIDKIYKSSPTDELITNSCAIITEQITNLISIVKANRYKPETLKTRDSQPAMFYQYSLGHNVFLHPRNFQQITCMLKNQSKPIEQAPRTVSGNIVHIQHEVMNMGNARRYRFLSHLPIYSEFTLCFLSLSDLEIPFMPYLVQDKQRDCSKDDDYSSSFENIYIYNRNSSVESRIPHSPTNTSFSPFVCTDEDFPSLE